jgi:hypothetical protein
MGAGNTLDALIRNGPSVLSFDHLSLEGFQLASVVPLRRGRHSAAMAIRGSSAEAKPELERRTELPAWLPLADECLMKS